MPSLSPWKFVPFLLFSLTLPLLPLLTIGENVASAAPQAYQESELWSQVPGNGYAHASQDFQSQYDGWDIFIADDFQNNDPWVIQTIKIPGAILYSTTNILPTAQYLTWAIFSNTSGIPSGSPTGLSAGSPFTGIYPIWTLSLTPNNNQIKFTEGIFKDNFLPVITTLTLSTPFILPSGHWWLVFYPRMDTYPSNWPQYIWQSSGNSGSSIPPILNVAQVVNPRGALNISQTWTAVNSSTGIPNITTKDFAFTLTGSALNRRTFFPLVMR